VLMAQDMRRCLDPCLLMRDAGLEPDEWQAKMLEERPKRALLCCCRQSGKTEVSITIAAAADVPPCK
jgi:hypothetical protein